MIGNHLSGCSVARSSRLVWDEEVAGSNPATPTKTSNIVTGFFLHIKHLIQIIFIPFLLYN